MPEEIKIVVKQESQGNALSDADQKMQTLKARIAELNRLEKGYEEKGIREAAQSVRSERTGAERELRGLERERAAETKQRADADRAATRQRAEDERHVTREMREQHAVAGARRRTAQTALSEAGSVAGIPGAGLVGGGVAGGLAVIAGAIIGKAIKDQMAFLDTKNFEEGNLTGTFNRSRRNRGRTNPFEAEQDAAAEYLRNKAEMESSIDKRGTFKNSTLSNVLTLGGLLGERDGDAAARENEERIARLQAEKARVQKDAEAAFTKGSGGQEMEMKRKLLDYDMQGVRASQDKISWMKEYDRVLKATGGNEALAQESAGSKVALEQRERAGQFAGLINARSGAGDIARAARLASATNPGDTNVGGEVARLRQAMNANHREALGAKPLKDWEQRP